MELRGVDVFSYIEYGSSTLLRNIAIYENAYRAGWCSVNVPDLHSE